MQLACRWRRLSDDAPGRIIVHTGDATPYAQEPVERRAKVDNPLRAPNLVLEYRQRLTGSLTSRGWDVCHAGLHRAHVIGRFIQQLLAILDALEVAWFAVVHCTAHAIPGEDKQ